MLRIIAGVIVGYIATFVVLFVCLSGLYLALGMDMVFERDTYNPTMTWIIPHLAIALFAAIIGGFVAGMIGKKASVPIAFAVFLFVLGIGVAAAELTMPNPDPGPRTGEVSNMDAMKKAKQPIWVSFALPIIGAAGGLLGGKLRKYPSELPAA